MKLKIFSPTNRNDLDLKDGKLIEGITIRVRKFNAMSYDSDSILIKGL